MAVTRQESQFYSGGIWRVGAEWGYYCSAEMFQTLMATTSPDEGRYTFPMTVLDGADSAGVVPAGLRVRVVSVE